MERLDHNLNILLTCIIVLPMFGCLETNNSSENKSHTEKQTNYLNLWQEDSLGCKGLRTIKLSDGLIKTNFLMGANKNQFLKVFGKPNLEIDKDPQVDLIYYYDSFCKDSKIVDSLDKCFAEYRFQNDTLINKRYYCN